MTTPKASGPLWVLADESGRCDLDMVCTPDRLSPGVPGYCYAECRLIPGHGRVVPVELVANIEAAFNSIEDYNEGDPAWSVAVEAAIRAALEGAV